ncbi:MAG: YjfB family protein [Lachnospiraceae bacterium]|nr:YjfB family protein [Lachnospiraceae bacterium]
MDIAALSTAMSMADVQTQFGMAMLDKSLENMETMGEGMQKILETSVNPHIGGNIDVSA